MSRYDISIKSTGGRNTLPTWTLGVAAGAATTIETGEPTVLSTLPNCILASDGHGTTSEHITGVAAADSTDTVAAAGTVLLWVPLEGVSYEIAPKVADSCNTAAKITALMLKHVPLDLTSSVFTLDTAASDGATNTVFIVGGNSVTDTAYFMFQHDGTVFFAG